MDVMYVGSNNVKDIALGSNIGTKLYLGETMIWGKGYIVAYHLTGVTTNGASLVQIGGSFSATLTASSSGSQINPLTLKIMMGDDDITSTAWNASTNTISIAEVTDDIDITAASIAIPTDYVPVKYISRETADASSVINTNYKPNNKTKIVLDVKLVEGYPRLLFGASNPNTAAPAIRFYAWIKITATAGAFGWGSKRQNTSATARLLCGTRFTFTCNRGAFSYKRATGSTVNVTLSDSAWTEDNNLCIFGANGINNYYGSGTIYKVTISEIETVNGESVETLKRDYIPVKRKSDGIAGLYDIVTQTFTETSAFSSTS